MKRRGALAGVVLAFAVAVAACGGGGGSDATVSIKTLQAAVSNTQAAPSSRFTMDMGIDASGKSVSLHAEGVSSADGKVAQITMTLPSLGTMEERVVDGTVYVNFGDMPFASKLGGKPWIAINLDALGQKTGTDFGALADQAQSSGPQQGLEYLQGLSGDVEKVGDDTVAGEHATHYRAQIDDAKVAQKLPEGATRDRVATLGVVPADVWIDDGDRVVKMQFAVDGSSFGESGARLQMTMEITDFGVPVDVQAPPPDQVTDFSTLGSIST
ncbi:MAG TPA: LppX_LprAFG lipoprotein [Acidimicrobiia bacterium]|nr:LppX_LprAFG lipoprotein [Acidimicrobiia bacterium]